MSAAAKKVPAWWEILEELGKEPQRHGVNRILAAGPPGTGKSTFPHRLYGQCEQAHLTEDSGPEDLLGMYSLKAGSTEFVDGPATRAFRHGRPIVLEEVDRGSASVQSILHAVLDDKEIAAVNLPNGERLQPAAGYLAIGTMNGRPEDLDEPVLDRFDIVLICNLPHPGILKRLPSALAKAVDKHYRGLAVPAHNGAMTARSAIAFTKLSKALGEDTAAHVVWGAKGKEMMMALAASA